MAARQFSRLRIDGWRQFQSIDLEIHPRLTIITGANGAGKSTLLSFFNRHFGYNRNYLATPRRSGDVVSFGMGLFRRIQSLNWFQKQNASESRTQIGEIRYTDGPAATLLVPTTSGVNYNVLISGQQEVPGIHIDSHRPPNIYRHVTQIPAAPPNPKSIGGELNNEYINYYSNGQIQSGSLLHIKMALIQMSIFGHGNGTMEPMPELLDLFEGFEEILKKLLPKSLGFEKIIIRSPEIVLSTSSGDFLLDASSGGIIKMFEIAWQLYFFSKKEAQFVITFDEPENHLHPSMQKSFIPSVMNAFPQAQLIVVTHSPFIISAIRDSAVYVLRYENSAIIPLDDPDDRSEKGMIRSRVTAEQLDMVNKAGTASEILRDVLGVSTTIPDWAEERARAIAEGYRGVAVTPQTLRALYSQFEAEGLISSYPEAIRTITGRPQ